MQNELGYDNGITAGCSLGLHLQEFRKRFWTVTEDFLIMIANLKRVPQCSKDGGLLVRFGSMIDACLFHEDVKRRMPKSSLFIVYW